MKIIINIEGRSPFRDLLVSVVYLTLVLINAGGTIAQPITPGADGTNTLVNIEGNQINITGGQTSGDRQNLFHSFEFFGLSDGQIANFLSNPEIQNIIGRVSGRNPSLINGLIQVTGGNSHLFLLNPAGMVFGANAQLNVPGDFTATTATGLGFNSGIFQAFGSNNYRALVGTPNYFEFGNIQPGSVINFGDLAVQPGQSLSLVGGTVLSTGSLSAPQGNLIITAIPGSSILRISQPGNLLSLDLNLTGNLSGEGNLSFEPLALSGLLTGGNIGHATDVTVNGSGEVVLSGSGWQVKPGDVAIATLNTSNNSAIASASISSENATLSAANNLTLVGSEIQTTGDLNLLGANTVIIRDNQNAFVAQSGGNITVEGRQAIDIFALNYVDRGATFQAGGDITLVSQGQIATDAHFSAGGNFFIGNLAGNSGDFFSYYDPIISANGSVLFGDYTGVSLKVEATGAISAVDITITGPDVTLSGDSDPDAATLANSPALILRSGVPSLSNAANIPPNLTIESTEFIANSQPNSNIFVSRVSTPGGPVIMESGGRIIIDRIATQGGEINLTAQENIQVLGLIDSSAAGSAGNVTISGVDVDIFSINAQGLSSETGGNVGGNINITGGNIDLNAQNNINVSGLLNSSASGSAGNATISGVDVDIFSINAQGLGSGTGGNVNITAGNFFRASGSFVDRNNITASVSTADAAGGGSITIRHEGGSETQFIIGDATTNGTAAALTTGVETISPTFEVPIGDDGIYTQGNMTIITTPDSLPPIDETQEAELESTELESTELESTELESTELESTELESTELVTENNSSSVILQITERTTNGSQIGLNFGSELLGLEILPEMAFEPILDNLIKIRFDVGNLLNRGLIAAAVPLIDRAFTQEVAFYNNIDPSIFTELITSTETTEFPVQSFDQIQEKMQKISNATGQQLALIYTFVRNDQLDTQDGQLDIVLVPTNGQPIYKRIELTQDNIFSVVDEFRTKLTAPSYRRTTRYLQSAQQLYQWIIAPIEADLERLDIDNLAFVMDANLRSIPLAALHDGEKFLIEKYSLGLIPSMNLTDTNYESLENAKVLAMGNSEFEILNNLPAVPLELSTITQKWSGDTFQNETFTVDNLRKQSNGKGYKIIHLATHAEFEPGEISNSYIQLWDRKLRLNEIRELGWHDEGINLLILSACRTMIGDEELELGFAGLAVQSRVKSAMGSLWYVDDRATLGFMSEFYRQLRIAFDDQEPTSPEDSDSPLKKQEIKAELLRQTQLAMLRGEVRVENGHLIGPNSDYDLVLPPEMLQGDAQFKHPYFWSGFSLVGSPW